MLGRANHDRLMEALEAADSAISASIARTENYGQRLEQFQDDYLEIAVLFWDRCPITRVRLEQPGRDAKKIARQFHDLLQSKTFNMWERNSIEQMIERCKRKIKGQLFVTARIMGEKRVKGNCENSNHTQPCHCKALNLCRLAEANESSTGSFYVEAAHG